MDDAAGKQQDYLIDLDPVTHTARLTERLPEDLTYDGELSGGDVALMDSYGTLYHQALNAADFKSAGASWTYLADKTSIQAMAAGQAPGAVSYEFTVDQNGRYRIQFGASNAGVLMPAQTPFEVEMRLVPSGITKIFKLAADKSGTVFAADNFDLAAGTYTVSLSWKNSAAMSGAVLKLQTVAARDAAIPDAADVNGDGYFDGKDREQMTLEMPIADSRSLVLAGRTYYFWKLGGELDRTMFRDSVSGTVALSEPGSREVVLNEVRYAMQWTQDSVQLAELQKTDVNHDGLTDSQDFEAFKTELLKPSVILAATQFDTKQGLFGGANGWTTPDGHSMITPVNREITYRFDAQAGLYDVGLNVRSNLDGIQRGYRARVEVLVNGQLRGELRLPADKVNAVSSSLETLLVDGSNEITYRWINDEQSGGAANLEIRDVFIRAANQDERLDLNSDGIVNTQDLILWRKAHPVIGSAKTVTAAGQIYDVTNLGVEGQPLIFSRQNDVWVSNAGRTQVLLDGRLWKIEQNTDGGVMLAELVSGDADQDGAVENEDRIFIAQAALQYSQVRNGVDFHSKSETFRYMTNGTSLAAKADAEAVYHFTVPQAGWYELDVTGGAYDQSAQSPYYFYNLDVLVQGSRKGSVRFAEGDYRYADQSLRVYLDAGENEIALDWNNSEEGGTAGLRLDSVVLKDPAMPRSADLDGDGRASEEDVIAWMEQNPDEEQFLRARIADKTYAVTKLPSGALRFTDETGRETDSDPAALRVNLAGVTYLISRNASTRLLHFTEKMEGDINLDGRVTPGDLKALSETAALESVRLGARDYSLTSGDWDVTQNGTRLAVSKNTTIEYEVEVKTDGLYDLGLFTRNLTAGEDWYRFAVKVSVDGVPVKDWRIPSTADFVETSTLVSLTANKHKVRLEWTNNPDSRLEFSAPAQNQAGPARLEIDGIVLRAHAMNLQGDLTNDGRVDMQDKLAWHFANPDSAAVQSLTLGGKNYFIASLADGSYAAYDPLSKIYTPSVPGRRLITLEGKPYVIETDDNSLVSLTEFFNGDLNLDGVQDAADTAYAQAQVSLKSQRFDGRDFFSGEGWTQHADGSVTPAALPQAGSISYRFDVPATGWYEFDLETRNAQASSAPAYSRLFMNVNSSLNGSVGQIRMDAARTTYATGTLRVFLTQGTQDISVQLAGTGDLYTGAALDIKSVALRDARIDSLADLNKNGIVDASDLDLLAALIPDSRRMRSVEVQGAEYAVEKLAGGAYRMRLAADDQSPWIVSDAEGRKIIVNTVTYLVLEAAAGLEQGKVSLVEYRPQDANLDGAVTRQDYESLLAMAARSQAHFKATEYTHASAAYGSGGQPGGLRMDLSGESIIAERTAGGLTYEFTPAAAGLYDLGVFLKRPEGMIAGADYRYLVAVSVDGVRQALLRSDLAGDGFKRLSASLNLTAAAHQIRFDWINDDETGAPAQLQFGDVFFRSADVRLDNDFNQNGVLDQTDLDRYQDVTADSRNYQTLRVNGKTYFVTLRSDATYDFYDGVQHARSDKDGFVVLENILYEAIRTPEGLVALGEVFSGDLSGDGLSDVVDDGIFAAAMGTKAPVVQAARNALSNSGFSASGDDMSMQTFQSGRAYTLDYLVQAADAGTYDFSFKLKTPQSAGLSGTLWAIYVDDWRTPYKTVEIPVSTDAFETLKMALALSAGPHTVRLALTNAKENLSVVVSEPTLAYPKFDSRADRNRDGRVDGMDSEPVLTEAGFSGGVDRLLVDGKVFHITVDRDGRRFRVADGTDVVFSDGSGLVTLNVPGGARAFWVNRDSAGQLRLVEKIDGDFNKDGQVNVDDRVLLEQAVGATAAANYRSGDAEEKAGFLLTASGAGLNALVDWNSLSNPFAFYFDRTVALAGEGKVDIQLEAGSAFGRALPRADYAFLFDVYVDDMEKSAGLLAVPGTQNGLLAGQVTLDLKGIQAGNHRLRFVWKNPVYAPLAGGALTGVETGKVTVRSTLYSTGFDFNTSGAIESADLGLFDNIPAGQRTGRISARALTDWNAAEAVRSVLVAAPAGSAIESVIVDSTRLSNLAGRSESMKIQSPLSFDIAGTLQWDWASQGISGAKTAGVILRQTAVDDKLELVFDGSARKLSLVRTLGTVVTTLAEAAISDEIHFGREYSLKAEVREDVYDIYLDGEALLHVKVEGLMSGQIGIFSDHSSTLFKKFSVKQYGAIQTAVYDVRRISESPAVYTFTDVRNASLAATSDGQRGTVVLGGIEYQIRNNVPAAGKFSLVRVPRVSTPEAGQVIALGDQFYRVTGDAAQGFVFTAAAGIETAASFVENGLLYVMLGETRYRIEISAEGIRLVPGARSGAAVTGTRVQVEGHVYEVTSLEGGVTRFVDKDSGAETLSVQGEIHLGTIRYRVSASADGIVLSRLAVTSSTRMLGDEGVTPPRTVLIQGAVPHFYAVTSDAQTGRTVFTDVADPVRVFQSDAFDGTVTLDGHKFEIRVIDPAGNIRLYETGRGKSCWPSNISPTRSSGSDK